MKYSDGKTVRVTAPAGGFAANRGYRTSGWNGVAELSASAAAAADLTIDPTATFYIKVPSGVAGALGDIIYMPAAGGAAESVATSTATSNIAAFKVHVAKDGNHIVGVRVLNVA